MMTIKSAPKCWGWMSMLCIGIMKTSVTLCCWDGTVHHCRRWRVTAICCTSMAPYFNRAVKCNQLLNLFTTVPDSSINSWESWFIFNLRKINTNQYYKSDFLDAGNCNTLREHMILQDDKCILITVHTWTAVFLKHPCDYVLHGLVPGLNWAPFWPLPMSMHLVAMPSPVSCCLLQRVKFHT
jgi:hypothetical protein